MRHPDASSVRRPDVRRACAGLTAALLVAGGLSTIVIASDPVQAALTTSALSSISKSGTDATTNSTADTASGTSGTTNPGDTVDWVLHYRNASTRNADVHVADQLDPNLSLVGGSIQAPPGFTTGSSTAGGITTVTADGPSVPGSTGIASTVVASPVLTPSTGIGDGTYPIFYKDNVYSVFHHRLPGGNFLFCRNKRTGGACAGFPTGINNTYVSTVAGAIFGTGSNLADTSYQPGVTQVGSRIYIPVEPTNFPTENTNTVGLLCADLDTNTSCGFIPFSTTEPVQEGGAADLGGDGTLVNGKSYYWDGRGNLFCFDPSTASTCGTFNVGPPPALRNQGQLARTISVTYDHYVFSVSNRLLTPNDVVGLSCFDALTQTECPGFPIANAAPATPFGGTAWNAFPMLDGAGAVNGVCLQISNSGLTPPFQFWRCFDLAGNTVASPVPDPPGNLLYGYNGLGFPLLVGTRVYASLLNTTYTCFDYALPLVGGKLQNCTGFARPTFGGTRNYSIKADPQNPSCLWGLGDTEHFDLVDAQTGGPCIQYVGSATVTPTAFYCDGQTTHVNGWNSVSITEITAAQFTSATVTVYDANGVPVPGFADVPLATGQTSLDISSIPATGNSATLSATVVMTGATAVSAAKARIVLSFSGDSVQVCFTTTVVPAQCLAGGSTISNSFSATTTVTAQPVDVNTSDAAVFRTVVNSAQCTISLSHVKSVVSATANGDGTWTVVYRLRTVAAGTGSTDYDLSDTLRLAPGVTVTSAAVTGSPVGVTPNAGWNGAFDTNVATGVHIPGGATQDFVLTVTANVPVTFAQPSSTDCTVGGQETGTGLDNTSTLTSTGANGTGQTLNGSGCAPLPSVSFAKRIDSVISLGNGQWQVDYTLSVDNNGSAATRYDLHDRLRYAPGITIDSATTTAPAGATTNAAWDGASDDAIVTGRPIGAGVGEVYTVRTVVTVPRSVPGPALVCGAGAPSDVALTNEAWATSNGVDTSHATPCADVPADVHVSKSVNPADGSTLVAGQSVTYTLTFDNSGGAAGSVDYTDDLSGVLDDASITAGPSASNPALTVGPIVNGAFRVSGSVPGNTTYTVTVTVTVLADGLRGDDVMDNFLVPTGTPPPSTCAPGDPMCTSNAVPELVDWKTVDPASGSSVAPGQTLTYTLHFQNTGAAPVTVNRVDDITQLTDDATVTGQPASSDPALTATAFVNGRTSITGTLAPGRTVTITYRVTVDNPENGDGQLANFLQNPADSPPSSPHCTSADPQHPDCTRNPAGVLTIEKTVDSVTPIGGGAYRVDYTLRVGNIGGAPGTYDLTDDLAYAPDITVVSTSIIDVPAGASANARWNGGSDDLVISGRVIAAGTVDLYRVRVVGWVPAATPLDPTETACGDSGDKSALNNTAAIVGQGSSGPAAACSELPSVELVKTVDSVSYPDDQHVRVVYHLTVHNGGAGDGVYDLTDHLRWGHGLTVTDVRVGPPSGAVVDPTFDAVTHRSVVRGQKIDAGGTQVWTVVVNGSIANSAEGAALDCAFTGGEDGTGLANTGVAISNGVADRSTACAPVDRRSRGGNGTGGLVNTGEPGSGRGPNVAMTAWGTALAALGLLGVLLIGWAGQDRAGRRRSPTR